MRVCMAWHGGTVFGDCQIYPEDTVVNTHTYISFNSWHCLVSDPLAKVIGGGINSVI